MIANELRVPQHLLAELKALASRHGNTRARGGGRLSAQSKANLERLLPLVVGDLVEHVRAPAKIVDISDKDAFKLVRHWVANGRTYRAVQDRVRALNTLLRWIHGRPSPVSIARLFPKEARGGTDAAVTVAYDASVADEAIEAVMPSNPDVALQLALGIEFGMTVAEVMALKPLKDFRNGQLIVSRGQRRRGVPPKILITTDRQRDILGRAQEFAMANEGGVVNPGLTVEKAINRFRAITRAAGLIGDKSFKALQGRAMAAQAPTVADRELTVRRIMAIMENMTAWEITRLEETARQLAAQRRSSD